MCVLVNFILHVTCSHDLLLGNKLTVVFLTFSNPPWISSSISCCSEAPPTCRWQRMVEVLPLEQPPPIKTPPAAKLNNKHCGPCSQMVAKCLCCQIWQQRGFKLDSHRTDNTIVFFREDLMKPLLEELTFRAAEAQKDSQRQNKRFCVEGLFSHVLTSVISFFISQTAHNTSS